MIKGIYSGDKVYSSSSEAFSLYEKSKLGEKIKDKIEYSFVEVLYLVEGKKMEVLFGNKMMDYDDLIRKIRKKDKGIELKYRVYADLRSKGYIVKTALKFGADFRVYEKGFRPGESHAKWIVYATYENSGLKWNEFAAKNRVAHSTKKKLLLGIVDEEGDVSYYEVDWARM